VLDGSAGVARLGNLGITGVAVLVSNHCAVACYERKVKSFVRFVPRDCDV
jgi:hypothetical protein